MLHNQFSKYAPNVLLPFYGMNSLNIFFPNSSPSKLELRLEIGIPFCLSHTPKFNAHTSSEFPKIYC